LQLKVNGVYVESLSKLPSLLRTDIKNAKVKHGAGKRVRVLFRLDEEAKT